MKVLTFGNFDFIHPGHISYLNFAKQQGGQLYTVVASDQISEKIKQRKNIFNQTQRILQIQKLQIADFVIAGHNKDPFKILLKIKPDIIVLGYDQKAPITVIQNFLPEVKILRAPEFKKHVYKSSLIKKNVLHLPSLQKHLSK